MKKEMAQAITSLLAHQETASLGHQLEAEYLRVRGRSTRAGWGIWAGLLVVAYLAGFFFALRNDPEYIREVWNSAFVWLIVSAIPAAMVLTASIVALFLIRNLYVRYRMCQFLDSRDDLSPDVAVARQMIATAPVKVLFRGLAIALPATLAAIGFAWAAVITAGAVAGLNMAKDPKSM